MIKKNFWTIEKTSEKQKQKTFEKQNKLFMRNTNFSIDKNKLFYGKNMLFNS